MGREHVYQSMEVTDKVNKLNSSVDLLSSGSAHRFRGAQSHLQDNFDRNSSGSPAKGILRGSLRDQGSVGNHSLDEEAIRAQVRSDLNMEQFGIKGYKLPDSKLRFNFGNK